MYFVMLGARTVLLSCSCLDWMRSSIASGDGEGSGPGRSLAVVALLIFGFALRHVFGLTGSMNLGGSSRRILGCSACATGLGVSPIPLVWCLAVCCHFGHFLCLAHGAFCLAHGAYGHCGNQIPGLGASLRLAMSGDSLVVARDHYHDACPQSGCLHCEECGSTVCSKHDVGTHNPCWGSLHGTSEEGVENDFSLCLASARIFDNGSLPHWRSSGHVSRRIGYPRFFSTRSRGALAGDTLAAARNYYPDTYPQSGCLHCEECGSTLCWESYARNMMLAHTNLAGGLSTVPQRRVWRMTFPLCLVSALFLIIVPSLTSCLSVMQLVIFISTRRCHLAPDSRQHTGDSSPPPYSTTLPGQ